MVSIISKGIFPFCGAAAQRGPWSPHFLGF